MKISIITIVYNNVESLPNTFKSIAEQTYDNIEYIVVDGGSKDGTVDVIRQNEAIISKWVSEPDKGLFDALNKGINMCSGDVIGVLHSDDIFYDKNTIANIAATFERDDSLEAVFSDIVFISKENPNKVIRRYSSKKWNPNKFVWGYMPAHTAFFVKKKCYEELGLYKTDYKISADYELLIRFLKISKVKYKYLPTICTKMRVGGLSTSGFKSLRVLNKEIIRACKENGLYTNNFMLYSKYFTKIFEFIKK